MSILTPSMRSNSAKVQRVPEPVDKQLRVWHIPQVPGSPFYVYVDTADEALIVMELLTIYDLWQYKNRIKPDYANAAGLEEYNSSDKSWSEWYDDDGNDIRDIEQIKKEAINVS